MFFDDGKIREMKRKIEHIHTLGVPYSKIAEQVGISGTMLSNWLKGKRNAGHGTLNNIQKYITEYDLNK